MELEAADKSQDQKETSQDELGMGALELCKVLDDLDAQARNARQESSAEARFARKIAFHGSQRSIPQNSNEAQERSQVLDIPETKPPSMTAIAACSDRLTTLESTLGLPTLSLSDGEAYPSVLPTLNNLANQISVLSMTLTPTNTQPPVSPIPTIDTLISRVKALTADADKLTVARKTAMTALTDLHEARLRYSSSHRPASSHARHQSQQTSTKTQEVDRSHAEMFLDSQSIKIDALYQTLPTIHQLSPLLPVVLERLRSLSVIHAGAAEVRGLMDELEANLGENQREIAQWREGVESCEKKIMGLTGIMENNVDVVGNMVRAVEERMDKLKG